MTRYVPYIGQHTVGRLVGSKTTNFSTLKLRCAGLGSDDTTVAAAVLMGVPVALAVIELADGSWVPLSDVTAKRVNSLVGFYENDEYLPATSPNQPGKSFDDLPNLYKNHFEDSKVTIIILEARCCSTGEEITRWAEYLRIAGYNV